ncbi:MAG: AIR synthase-related protein [Candidatus Moraniibacteriota bacterium]
MLTHGFREVRESRGESAYVVDFGPFLLAFVEEGLGTKNKVAEEMRHLEKAMRGLTGRTFYDKSMQCNAAMAFNDLSSVGAAPIISMLHVAAGSSKFFTNEKCNRDIVNGHALACNLAGCSWGGGESPTLQDIIYPGTGVFAGSAIGLINPKENLLLGSRIKVGDRIILLYGSGIHANGLTLARYLAELLERGYLTELPSGITYGEALLEPTVIYAPAMNACVSMLHYGINITGHGWRKLMRALQSFRYVIERIPEKGELFEFMQEHGKISDREAYGNLNMNAGFAFIAPPENVEKILLTIERLGFDGLDAGHVESADRRSVVIEPLDNMEFKEEELQVR